MKKSFLFISTFLLLFMDSLLGWVPYTTIEEGIRHFKMEGSENQIAALTELEVVLDPSVLEYLADKLGKNEREIFLQNLMRKYSADERQDIINALIEDGKYRINTQKIMLSEKEIMLDSDRFGPISLSMIFSDNEGVWALGFCSDQCDACGKYYNYKPSECYCGNNSFKPVENSDK